MLLERFYKQLAIPDSCFLGKRVYKKQFYDNASLSKADQQRFSEQIDTVQWRYTLKPVTINIPKYIDEQREYLEIALLQVNLKGVIPSDSQRSKLADIIQRAIPYPLVLVFVHEQQIAIQLAYKRINQADNSRLTLERSFDTGWINLHQPEVLQQDFLNDFAISHCRFNNLYQCYQDLVQRVVALNCAGYTGSYRLSTDTEDNRQARLDQLRNHQQQLAQLRSELKKETRFNYKVELNMHIKQLDQTIQALKTQL